MITVGGLKKRYDKLFSNLTNRKGLFRNISTSLTVNKLYKELINTLTGDLEQIYVNEVEKTNNLFGSNIKKRKLNKIIKEKIDNKDFIDRLKKYAKVLKKDMKFIKSPNDLKIRLQSEFKRVKNLFRSEKHRVQEKTKSMIYDRVKPDNIIKIWKATMRNTRDTHIYLNGKTPDKDGFFHSSSGHMAKYPKGFGVAAEDCGCNCILVFKKI